MHYIAASIVWHLKGGGFIIECQVDVDQSFHSVIGTARLIIALIIVIAFTLHGVSPEQFWCDQGFFGHWEEGVLLRINEASKV
jgi:hypothetical protein